MEGEPSTGTSVHPSSAVRPARCGPARAVSGRLDGAPPVRPTAAEVPMPNLVELAEITPIQVWEGVVARRVQGEQLTLAVVELAPDSIVPEHRHTNEQGGIVIGDETRSIGPGGTWRILGNEPHEVHTGPEGATVIDVFAPIRSDWEALPVAGTPDDPAPMTWPAR